LIKRRALLSQGIRKAHFYGEAPTLSITGAKEKFLLHVRFGASHQVIAQILGYQRISKK